MVKTKNVLASVAAAGLLVANPALAQSTRSSDALPSASAPITAIDFSRAAAPVEEASEARRRGTLLLILFGVAVAVGLLIAAGSGGGNDSPG